ncbi:hypothetical protein TNCV_2796601 [Trichonephila clavipes]|nr:hypothetical protein TNCV_2796601 [Trichonephila clavipes]
MTDNEKTTGPAFKKVFGDGVKHLLCKWHLHRAWKKQLNNLVSGFEIRNEIYASLIPSFENIFSDNEITEDVECIPDSVSSVTLVESGIDSSVEEACDDERKIRPKREIGDHQTCLSINRLWQELCDMLRCLVGTTAPGHHDCSIQE